MTAEKTLNPFPGWLALILVFAFLGLCIFGIAHSGSLLNATDGAQGGPIMGLSIFGVLTWLILLCGFFIVNPNDSKVLVLFGTYKGTVRANGFFWTNPFMSKTRMTVRARNMESEKLKVNDLVGNPVEIGVVVVWKVENTAQAAFDVDDYEGYVVTQSEAAVRQLAGSYPYDHHDDENEDDTTISLRESREQINVALEEQLTERLGRAGVGIIEARLTHLAYAPEIAGAMLQRQQAAAVVAARRTIVDGAVGMVEMALERIEADKVVELDAERKAAMVSNLLVVLCGDRNATPVVNAGGLYS